MNMILQLGSNDEKKEIIIALKEVDLTRKLYYDYLL